MLQSVKVQNRLEVKRVGGVDSARGCESLEKREGAREYKSL